MNPRERFNSVIQRKIPQDRFPLIEWAPWWDLTINRWRSEGLNVPQEELHQYFDLDPMLCIMAGAQDHRGPQPAVHGGGLIATEADYNELRKWLFTNDIIEQVLASVELIRERHERGECIVRFWLDGFFWLPRVLFGIESHLYAFYDEPQLMHRINSELAEFNFKLVDALVRVIKPDLIGFAEDMSYNHGPMVSKKQFDTFLLPYYQRLIPELKRMGLTVLVDSDGDITQMLPWLMEAGLDGVFPLERQAGVDLVQLREKYPEFLFMGGYDKRVMHLGQDALRAEFDRLFPVLVQGGYILSVDHQTPPEVSLTQYMDYLALSREYASSAVIADELSPR